MATCSRNEDEDQDWDQDESEDDGDPSRSINEKPRVPPRHNARDGALWNLIKISYGAPLPLSLTIPYRFRRSPTLLSLPSPPSIPSTLLSSYYFIECLSICFPRYLLLITRHSRFSASTYSRRRKEKTRVSGSIGQKPISKRFSTRKLIAHAHNRELERRQR